MTIKCTIITPATRTNLKSWHNCSLPLHIGNFRVSPHCERAYNWHWLVESMYKEMHVYMGQPSLRPLWSTSDSRATKLQTLTTRRPKPPVTRGMSHLKRNLILEQKSPLNSLAYSSINWSKTFSFTAEYSFIRHKWTLYYRNAPPPESGNLQLGMGIRKNTGVIISGSLGRTLFFTGFCFSVQIGPFVIQRLQTSLGLPYLNTLYQKWNEFWS